VCNYQAINNLALVTDNQAKIVEAGAVQVYVELLNSQYAECIQKEAAHGLYMLAFKWKDVLKEHGCVEGQYFCIVAFCR